MPATPSFIRAEQLLIRIDETQTESDQSGMSETQDILPAETAGTEITRFNALKHGVLSRYTVLRWEDADICSALVAS